MIDDLKCTLDNPVTLGLHLRAGASDNYITSATELKDERRDQSVQRTLDEIVEFVANGEYWETYQDTESK